VQQNKSTSIIQAAAAARERRGISNRGIFALGPSYIANQEIVIL